MAFGAVLDACVLYPFSVCDILLRLAERGLYDVYWSDRILRELERNLVKNRITRAQAKHRIGQMRQAFPEAEVPAKAIKSIEPCMGNDPKDRHVLAAAVASPAEAIVTSNLKDFPAAVCRQFDIEAVHPDVFLLDLFSLSPTSVSAEINRQVASLRNPPITRQDLKGMLAAAGVKGFASKL